MKPSFLNLFMKKFTRDLVVPIISANISWKLRGAPFEVQILGHSAPAAKGPRQPFLLELKADRSNPPRLGCFAQE